MENHKENKWTGWVTNNVVIEVLHPAIWPSTNQGRQSSTTVRLRDFSQYAVPTKGTTMSRSPLCKNKIWFNESFSWLPKNYLFSTTHAIERDCYLSTRTCNLCLLRYRLTLTTLSTSFVYDKLLLHLAHSEILPCLCHHHNWDLNTNFIYQLQYYHHPTILQTCRIFRASWTLKSFDHM